MTGFIPKHVSLMEYKIYLSPSRYALFTIPEDLSIAEGERLARILAATAGAYEDDVPVFKGTCKCEHPDYDHAMGSCDPDCDCQAGWHRMPYIEALKETQLAAVRKAQHQQHTAQRTETHD